MFAVNYHNGTEKIFCETMDAAAAYADEHAIFTQQNISVDYADGPTLMTRHWYCIPYRKDELQEDPIKFGNRGHYGDWCFD